VEGYGGEHICVCPWKVEDKGGDGEEEEEEGAKGWLP